jgi:uncharacterized protein
MDGMDNQQTRPPLEVRERHHVFSESIPKYFDSGNAVLTAEWNALALSIPVGERFFIRSIQRIASQAKSPGLKLQISGFIGQEAMHARETNRSTELLGKRGFPVQQYQAWYDGVIKFWERWLPFPNVHLASTAAAEHYTTALSIWLLSSHYGGGLPPAIRDLWTWHCAEELEHKALAFDLLQEVSPCGYLRRVTSYFIPLALVWWSYRKALRLLLKWEGLSRAQIREERKLARKIRIPLFSWRLPHLWDFLKPRFHPNDLDDGGLGKQILAEQAARARA